MPRVSQRGAVTQLGLLRSARGFRLLFLSTLGSGVGTWLAFVALTVDVYDRTHSGAWVAALLIVDFLPIVVLGLLAGPLVDRYSRRMLMVLSDLLRCVVFCVLPFVSSPTGIVALAGVAGVATSFFRPAVYAGLPNLVSDDELPQANSVLGGVDSITTAVGPLLGGALVAVQGPDLAYWLNAATFLLSAALIVRIGGSLRSERAPSRGHLGDLADGLRLVRGSRALVTVAVAWSVALIASAFVNVSEVVLAKDDFRGGDVGFGLLLAGAGLGVGIGSLSAGSWIERWSIGRVYGSALTLMAVGAGAAAASPSVWVASACVVVSGFGNGAAVVCNALLVQRGAPDRLRGRAFTVVMSANYLVLGVAMVAAGPLTDAVGGRWMWGTAALVTLAAAVIGSVLVRGAAPLAVEPPITPAPEPGVPPAAVATTASLPVAVERQAAAGLVAEPPTAVGSAERRQ